MQAKPNISTLKIILMNIAFFGLQFGFALQIANISVVYECLGAKAEMIPILWLAAPAAGLFVQPIIGVMSDKTWCFLGRRRPYIFIGLLVSGISLFLMPYCSNLISISLAIWLFFIFINVAMGPLKTFIADSLNSNQITLGYSVQNGLAAAGGILASCLPWLLINLFNISNITGNNNIPEAVHYSFSVGFILLVVTGILSIITGKEYPPKKQETKLKVDRKNILRELTIDVIKMPTIMKNLAVIQFFGWMGLFLMFMYFPPIVAKFIFNGNPGTVSYNNGVEWAGLCFGLYSGVQLMSSFALPWTCRRLGEKKVYFTCMIFGAFALLSVSLITSKYMLIFPMLGVGVMFAAINTIPFALLGKTLPANKVGAYMGLFNIFITLPGILVSLCFGEILKFVFSNDIEIGIIFAGLSMAIAALFIMKMTEGINTNMYKDHKIKKE